MKCLTRLLCVLGLMVSVALAEGDEKLTPIGPYIDEMVKEATSEKPSFSQVSYVATRAAVLFTALAVHLETYQGGLRKETDTMRTKLLDRSLNLLQLADALNARVDKMDAKNIDARLKAIREAYTKLIAESKTLNNTIFSKFISLELDKMNEIYPFLENAHREIFESSFQSR